MTSTLNLRMTSDSEPEIREELSKHTDAILKWIQTVRSQCDPGSSVGFQAFPTRLALVQVNEYRKEATWENKDNKTWCVRLVTADRAGKVYKTLGDWEQKDTKLEAYKAMTEWVEMITSNDGFDWKK